MKLKVLDLRAILHNGNMLNNVFVMPKPEPYSKDDLSSLLPAGGTAQLLKKLCYLKRDGYDIVICADSKTSFRKKISSYYKSSRHKYRGEDYYAKVNADNRLAFAVLDYIGIPYYVVEGYEADDLIAAVTFREKSNYDMVELMAEDSDLQALLDTNVTMTGVRENYITKTLANAELGKYASIYKVFQGDTSDDILPIYSIDYPWLKHFLKLPADLVVHKEYIKYYVSTLNLDADLRERLDKNIELVYLNANLEFDYMPKQIDDLTFDKIRNVLGYINGYSTLSEQDINIIYTNYVKEN